MASCLAAVAGAVALGTPAFATQALGDLRFSVPPGWTLRTMDGYARYESAVGPAARACHVDIGWPRPSSGHADDEFRQLWQKLGTGAAVPTPNLHTLRAGWVMAGIAQFAPEGADGNMSGGVLVVEGHGHTQAILLWGADASCAPALRAFVLSIDAVDPPPQPPLAAAEAQPAEVVGMWRGLTSGALPGLMSSLTPSTSERYVLFLADGRYAEMVPPAGIDDDALAALPSSLHGRYRLQGRTVILMPQDPSKSGSFRLSGDTLSDHAGFLMHKRPTDGLRVDAVYSAAVSPQSWSRQWPQEPTLALTRDGRFSDHGALSWVAMISRVKNGLAVTGGEGRYEAANYTMRFLYDDGRVFRLTLNAAESDRLVLAGQRLMLKR
jgi:hypothetical protein